MITYSFVQQTAAEQDCSSSSPDKKPRVKNSSSRPRHTKHVLKGEREGSKELSSARLKSYGLGKKRKRKK